MGDSPQPADPSGLEPRGAITTPSQPLLTGVSLGTKQESLAGGDQKLSFLYKALDDAQSIIRLLDAKAAFAVALVSAMAGKVLADLPFYFPLAGQPVLRKALLLSFWVFILLTGFLVFRVIFPVNNPTSNVRLSSADCRPQFFLAKFEPKRWLRIWSRAPRFSMLAPDQKTLLEDLSRATTDSLIASMTGEVMKVSYIRQIKADRLRAAGFFLFASSILFVSLVTSQSMALKIPGPQRVTVEGPVEVNGKPNVQPVASPCPPATTPGSNTKGPRVKSAP